MPSISYAPSPRVSSYGAACTHSPTLVSFPGRRSRSRPRSSCRKASPRRFQPSCACCRGSRIVLRCGTAEEIKGTGRGKDSSLPKKCRGSCLVLMSPLTDTIDASSPPIKSSTMFRKARGSRWSSNTLNVHASVRRHEIVHLGLSCTAGWAIQGGESRRAVPSVTPQRVQRVG